MFSTVHAEATEDARLAAHFRRFLEDEMRRQPSLATRLGDHRYDHLLDDLSPEAQREMERRTQQVLDDLLKTIDYAKLSRDGQIDYEIWAHELKKSLWLLRNQRPFETDPRLYIDMTTGSVFSLLTQSTLPRERNIENATARIAFIPRIVAAAKASLKNPPRIWVEVAIQQNRGAIAFYEKGIFDITGETQGSPLHAACRRILPSLREFQEFLEKELLPRASGEWRLGADRFREKLRLELDAGVEADQVLADAEAEAERVHREMAFVSRQLWSRYFPNEPVPPNDEAGRRELILRVVGAVSREHGKVEELVRDAEATVERIRQFIRERDILKLPEPDRCRIIEMPEFQCGFSVAYLNPAPPLDPDASSYYAVSPPPQDWDARRVESYLQEYNRHMLQILTIHEAYPGHYVQLEYANRHPSLIRKVYSSGVFAEGWAVYTEQMMLDQGYGEGDLALRLNQLKFYLRAVINAILDHQMHCRDMTDEQAKDLLMNRGFQSEGEALGKIQRAKLSSTQLSTYFVGRMAFDRLRQKVQRQQAQAFHLGRYHEAVLRHGSIPVKYLPELLGAKD
ncbi:MAG: DUF885 domain-containing protein [Gemmataceae bacterium]|nr:DUF885 domain-containing protein [Gemmataceae bacterium]